MERIVGWICLTLIFVGMVMTTRQLDQMQADQARNEALDRAQQASIEMLLRNDALEIMKISRIEGASARK